MKTPWLSSVLPIAALFAFRMLGLFMLIPIFTVYAPALTHATPTLIGIALGSYGLSQGILQMPFGLLSDRFGRKPMLAIGLVLFALGSLIGGLTDSIYGVIIARILQGMGAIGSVLIALLADLTPESQRTKAMAVVGMSIGLSFAIAMIISPSLATHFGLQGIFYFTLALATSGLVLLYFVIPTPSKPPITLQNKTHRERIMHALSDKELMRLNIGIFCQHLIMTSTFFVIPLQLQIEIQHGHLSQGWQFYLPLLLSSFLLIFPLIAWSEKKHHARVAFLIAIALTTVSQLILFAFAHAWYFLCGGMFIYFIAFNFLEANLPSLISKQANLEYKGTAMGIYSSSQFLGIFAGGSLAGLLYQFSGQKLIFITNALIAFLWWASAFNMKVKTSVSLNNKTLN